MNLPPVCSNPVCSNPVCANRGGLLIAFLRERLYQYALLVRLNRPIGILLLLWPALWALWIAGASRPDPMIVAIFVAGVVLMRSAGCAINDFADRGFDPYVARTAERPLATGHVCPAEAVAVFLTLSTVSFGLVLLMNRLTVLLSLVAILLAASYPFMKRYTDLPQVYLYLFQDGYGFADNLTGYTVSTWGSMTWGVQNWKYK